MNTLTNLHVLLETAERNPQDGEAAAAVATAEAEREDLASALRWIDCAIQCNPSVGRYHHIRGTILLSLGQTNAAIDSLERALSLAPDATVRAGLAKAYVGLEEFKRAERQFIEAVRSDGGDFSLNLGLAECFIRGRNFRETMRHARRLLGRFANLPILMEAIAVAFLTCGRHADALACVAQLQTIMPASGIAFTVLAEIATRERNLAEAEKYHLQAVSANPLDMNAQQYYLMHLARSGQEDLARAHFRNLHRLRLQHFPGFANNVPLWDGSPLDGRTILLDPLRSQGYGDTLNFIRFARRLKEMDGCVHIAVRPRIGSLLATVSGVDVVSERYRGSPAYDCAVELHCLWLMLNDTLASIGEYVPYVHPDRTLVAAAVEKVRTENACKIGIIWESSEEGRKNPYTDRSLPFAFLAPLVSIRGSKIFSLQKGRPSSRVHETGWSRSIVDLSDLHNDFMQTAALMMAMDLIISVDTSSAHLAGALGRPIFVMLAHTPEWRFMLDRQDSPWYPTMRLFRQPSPGDWYRTVAELLFAVESFVTRFITTQSVKQKPQENIARSAPVLLN